MQAISPEIIFRGINSWNKALPEIQKFTRCPLILGRSEIPNIMPNVITISGIAGPVIRNKGINKNK